METLESRSVFVEEFSGRKHKPWLAQGTKMEEASTRCFSSYTLTKQPLPEIGKGL